MDKLHFIDLLNAKFLLSIWEQRVQKNVNIIVYHILKNEKTKPKNGKFHVNVICTYVMNKLIYVFLWIYKCIKFTSINTTNRHTFNHPESNRLIATSKYLAKRLITNESFNKSFLLIIDLVQHNFQHMLIIVIYKLYTKEYVERNAQNAIAHSCSLKKWGEHHDTNELGQHCWH